MGRSLFLSYSNILLLIVALQIFTEVRAQGLEVGVAIDAKSAKARVSGRFSDGFVPVNPRNVVFKKEVVGNAKLAEWVSGLELSGSGPVRYRQLMPGEYLAESAYRTWSYTVDLKPPTNRMATAHSSWIGEDAGMLMLDDLVPHFGAQGKRVEAKVTLTLPSGWLARSAENTTAASSFDIKDVERSVIVLTSGPRNLAIRTKQRNLDLVIVGQWLFADIEAAQMAGEIFGEYSEMFGDLPEQPYQIALLKFPTNEPAGAWEAETRGRTVLIMSSDMPFKAQSLQRLHEQLRHELFHLWFPNGVNLTGDYAWFYEGFALYESLKLAVKMNRIRFADFLDTLSRAYTIDANVKSRQPLIGQTPVDPTVRYARGMLIAFLTDVAVLQNSKGKSDVSSILKAIFEKHGLAKPVTDGNTAVTDAIGSKRITDQYVLGTSEIAWTEPLAAIGIESKTEGRTTTLSIASKLSGRQKAILDRLGYNNWRKLGFKR